MRTWIVTLALLVAPPCLRAESVPPYGSDVIVDDGNHWQVHAINPVNGTAYLLETITRAWGGLTSYTVLHGAHDVRIAVFDRMADRLWFCSAVRAQSIPRVTAFGRMTDGTVLFTSPSDNRIHLYDPEAPASTVLTTLPAGTGDVQFIARTGIDDYVVATDQGRNVLRVHVAQPLSPAVVIGTRHDVWTAATRQRSIGPNAVIHWWKSIASDTGIWFTGVNATSGGPFYGYYDFATRTVPVHAQTLSYLELLDATTGLRAIAAVGQDYVSMNTNAVTSQATGFFSRQQMQQFFGTSSPLRNGGHIVALDHPRTNQSWLQRKFWQGMPLPASRRQTPPIAPSPASAPSTAATTVSAAPPPPPPPGPPEDPRRTEVLRCWRLFAGETPLPERLPTATIIAFIARTDLHHDVNRVAAERWATLGLEREGYDGLRATRSGTIALADLIALFPRPPDCPASVSAP